MISKRGGLDQFQQRINKEKAITDEMMRIAREAKKLTSKHTDIEFIKSLISSESLDRSKVDEIIEMVHHEFQKKLKDDAITPKTILGSMLGTVIASLIGGIIWGLQLITMARMFVILVIGIAFINYGIIRLLTRQTKQNKVIYTSVIISVILSVLIGFLLYILIGYQGGQFKL